ncbi:hypothetical protein OG426_52290 [Streptomyces canus]|uniref:hypothetical protein n=1 Tax=Streptomyces canus TaxID=58343 RepID=UPI0022544FF4|nr:hypothetical protein [Streptomyces canus]MCX4854146.1 hypothetical protein [Streptomyces canus]WSW40402.1 hypothetical protein OG426_52290 [Streptomyces canus]
MTGGTDEDSGSTLATADANLSGTRELLTVLKRLLRTRSPRLLTRASTEPPAGSWRTLQIRNSA